MTGRRLAAKYMAASVLLAVIIGTLAVVFHARPAVTVLAASIGTAGLARAAHRDTKNGKRTP